MQLFCILLLLHIPTSASKLPPPSTIHRHRNVDLHAQTQISGNGWTFPGNDVLFQISSDYILTCFHIWLWTGFYLSTHNHWCKVIWSHDILSGDKGSMFSTERRPFRRGRVGSSAAPVQNVSLKVSHSRRKKGYSKVNVCLNICGLNVEEVVRSWPISADIVQEVHYHT